MKIDDDKLLKVFSGVLDSSSLFSSISTDLIAFHFLQYLAFTPVSVHLTRNAIFIFILPIHMTYGSIYGIHVCVLYVV